MFQLKNPGKIALSLLLVASLLIVGCWGSDYSLIPPDQAKVDLAYVGDWNLVTDKGEHATMVIRNIDNKLYYVEVRDKDDKDPDRYVGFLADVNGATFAHLRAMKDSGKIEDGWILMRIALAGDKLTLDQLSDDFFKNKTIASAVDLRHVLEQNLNNEAMYAKDERLTGTRVVAK
jgi:hypothetical protein